MFKEQFKLLLPQENYKCFALFYTLDIPQYSNLWDNPFPSKPALGSLY